ncbi:MAG: hypothetical protein ACRD99_01375 [Nitrososphaera sp.]
MLLPEKCSIKIEGEPCQLAPTYVVSVASEQGEYMLAVVCDEHQEVIQGKLLTLQEAGKIPRGKIKFESVRTVVTDCVMGMNDDYVDIELSRGVESDRKLS